MYFCFWKRGLSAVRGVTRCLSQEGKCSWKGFTGQCRGVTSNTQKKTEKWGWIWMAILKPQITEKYSTPKYAKKLLKAKRILKPKYKPSGGPSFTFTVACSGDNSPLRQQRIDPNTVKISNDNLRVLRPFASRESNRPNEASDGFSPTGLCKRAGAYTSSGKFSGDTFLWQEVFWCAILKYFFTATFCWNSINSSWILAASTPVVSNCRSSVPPLSSVNDGSLPGHTMEWNVNLP